MTRQGLTAGVCVVGELARALRARGREDVIAAMARHEIGYHSNLHSMHPTWAEYLDTMSFEEGVARVLREEARGLADVAETFGQHPAAWVEPGVSWGPPVVLAMAQLGVPIFGDLPLEAGPGRPLWYMGALGLSYHCSFDRYFAVPRAERLARMQADFAARCRAHDGGYVLMYTHPCRLFTARFTDSFTAGKQTPREGWRPSPLRPQQEIRELMEDCDRFLGWAVAQPGVEPTSYRALYQRLQPPAAAWIASGALLADDPAAPLDARTIQGQVLSPAEVFGAVAYALAELAAGRAVPPRLPVRRLLGPTRTPPRWEGPHTVSGRDVGASAAWVDRFCWSERAVPAAIPIGAEEIGPGTWLQAAARVLRSGGLPSSIEVPPGEEYPALARGEAFQRVTFTGKWTEFPPDFEGQNVIELARLQTWTAKPAWTSDEATHI